MGIVLSFDHRVALNPALEETAVTQCYACRAPLSVEDQQSEHYEFGINPSALHRSSASKES